MDGSERDEMRGNQCAINSPRFTATSSRGPIRGPESFPFGELARTAGRSAWPTAILFPGNYFNLPFHPVSRIRPGASGAPPFSYFFTDPLPFRARRRENRDLWGRVYYRLDAMPEYFIVRRMAHIVTVPLRGRAVSSRYHAVDPWISIAPVYRGSGTLQIR